MRENSNSSEDQTLSLIDRYIQKVTDEIEWFLENTDKDKLSDPHRAEMTIKYFMVLLRLIDQKLLTNNDLSSHEMLQKEMIAWIYKREEEERLAKLEMMNNRIISITEEPDSPR